MQAKCYQPNKKEGYDIFFSVIVLIHTDNYTPFHHTSTIYKLFITNILLWQIFLGKDAHFSCVNEYITSFQEREPKMSSSRLVNVMEKDHPRLLSGSCGMMLVVW